MANRSIVPVNGIYVATLGHGIDEPTISHVFLGTEIVVDNLKIIDGWEDGLITLQCSDYLRSSSTNLIHKIVKLLQNY